MESTLVPPGVTAKPEGELLGSAVMRGLRQAQATWAAAGVRERLRVIRRLRQAMPEMQAEFCEATRQDLHKPDAETLAGELLPVAGACKYLEKHAARLLKPRKVSWFDTPVWLFGERDEVVRKARGVVGIIGTWNYPYFLNTIQILQALAAGNVVIWKPSEVAPHSAGVIGHWLRRAEVPADLVHVLPPAREWGQRLAEADVDYIVFTGHDNTGRKLAARLGERLIPSTLELSGHDAVLVLEDADVELTAKALTFGVTMNAGQTCLAPRRAFVSRRIYAALQDRLRELITKATPRTLAQVQEAGHVNRLLRQALDEGARLVTPAELPFESEATYPPVVLADVRPEMPIAGEAIFAPALLLLPFEELGEALEGIRQSDYGLGLSIFSAEIGRAKQLAMTLPAGLVSINDVVAPVAHPATPFGGVGRSGWGVTQGAEGLLEMTVPQVISHRRGSWRPHFAPPETTVFTSSSVLGAMLKWQHARTLGQRLRGLWAMLRAARRVRKNQGQAGRHDAG